MPSLKQLRERLLAEGIQDNSRDVVETHDLSLHMAVEKSAQQLGVPVEHIRYELVQKGSTGVFGLGSIPYIIRAYIDEKIVKEQKEQTQELDTSGIRSQAPYVILLDKRFVYLKATTSNLSLEEIMTALTRRTTAAISRERVTQVLRKAKGKFEEITVYNNDLLSDVKINCIISPDNIHASIEASDPGLDGADPSVDSIKAVLKQEGIIYGIQMQRIEEFVESPIYNTLVQVVQADSPEQGKDAYIEYKFETSPARFILGAQEDKIDYRELNNLQNVQEGEVLAIKHLAKKGKDGTSIFGETLFADEGEDVTLQVGENVELSSDGLQAIATASGHVRLKGKIIVVEPVFYVRGDVDIRTGNIHFVGGVYVQGSVTDGFTVEADGDIRVIGSIGKARVVSKRNIYVYRGIAGKGQAYIEAKENIWARFVEHCTVKVGQILVVSDGIMNSHIISLGSVICRGRRASIIGGEIRATNYIDAKNLGSPSGVRTVVEVGTDPELYLKRQKLEEESKSLQLKLKDVPLNIAARERKLKMIDIQTSEEAGNEKEQLKNEISVLQSEQSELKAQFKIIEEKLILVNNLLLKGKGEGVISVHRKLYAGVQIYISQAYLDVRKGRDNLSLYNNEEIIRIKPYQAPKINLPNIV